MLTNEWETLKEIAKRTGQSGEQVSDSIKTEFRSGRVEIKFDEIAGIKITQFRKKLMN